MNLLVIRHAAALDREEFAATGQDDSLRPLTARGRQRMVEGARGLARLVKTVTVLATSPYVRSVETAAIVAGAFPGLKPEVLPALTPDGEYRTLVLWLRQQARNDTIAIVGHEPHLSGFVCHLLTGGEGSFLELRKGSACLLSLPDPVRAGGAILRWALKPGQVRRIGLLPPEDEE